ncbi:MAG: dihydroorotate dehydrogenase electron transfer subunit [Bacteroidaceae bacterium]|nr:dihydroorotate dehydrogenase electron transfer subunit [Bacteroidaceae bacterium]
MKKHILDLSVVRMCELSPGYFEIHLISACGTIPEMHPGQFVQVRVDGSPETFLRRPISVNLLTVDHTELWLLVHAVGAGTKALACLNEGHTLNLVGPLGNGFTLPSSDEYDTHPLLVGGGVGTAPLLFLGQELSQRGIRPTFLLGGKRKSDIMQLEHFQLLGDVALTTEDGSVGERGFVTQHSIWHTDAFTQVYTCGPKPMMVNVARIAHEQKIPCEASLENMMACGLGACLCCVEDTVEGNLCVCSEGPVFDTSKLKWI